MARQTRANDVASASKTQAEEHKGARMINQCSSCGGFCKKSGCERENVKPTPQRTWVGLMRGVRVEGDTLVITVKGGNDAARELCGALIEEMNK